MKLTAVSTSFNNISLNVSSSSNQNKVSFLMERCDDDSDSILDYYHDLCKKYPNVSFRLEDLETGSKMPSEPPYLGYNNSFNQIGDNFGNPGQCSITIDKKVIENMQKDTVYKEIVYSYIENLEAQQVGYQQYATQEGMSCFAHILEDNNGVLAPSTTYAHSAFSTEEEVRKIWKMEASNKEIAKTLEQLKDDMIDTYLAMIEQSKRTKDKILTGVEDSPVNNIIHEIHDKFGLYVGESGHRIECYIPGEVLYQMTKNDSLKNDVYTVLEDYTCLEAKRIMDEIDPPMKKVTLIFDDDANVVANCEADMNKLEEEYEQIKRRKQTLSILGPVSNKVYNLIIEYNEDSPNIDMQSVVATSIFKKPFLY